ncbi:6-phospho-3-hexuloisomerase [Paenibacillus guangzhouensis]|uniref:6-phospho-3-hexuloisomerase n=1 Tax=Paenibacillus guangzhouensis TaxID=1473112 RepID=UPI0012671340|nr:6-phospho-3-hexuloisomerase [Paenibacillus guangzhouensis]
MQTTMRDQAAGILEELTRTVQAVDEASVNALIAQIIRADRIMVAGAGRSGLMMRAFAMRLMHLGFNAYVVGETVTPGLGENGLLIIGSGSGETKSLVAMAEKARGIGASVAAITIHLGSTIGELADTIVQVPAASKENTSQTRATIQPMGALFEQSLLILFDAMILQLMNIEEIDNTAMFGRHANLE